MTSVPADGEATLRAGRPTVKKNMSVPQTTAVLRVCNKTYFHDGIGSWGTRCLFVGRGT